MTITMEDLAADVGMKAPSKPKKKRKTDGADRTLVASVRIELRQMLAATADKAFDDIGPLLVNRFFGGDYQRYGGKNPDDPSLEMLYRGCGKHDLHVSRTQLSNAIRAFAMRCHLEEGKKPEERSAFSQLSPSHRIELLCLGDPSDAPVREKVERLATESLGNEYSVRELRWVLDNDPEREKRQKSVGRTVDRCVGTVTDKETGELVFTGEDFEQLDADQVGHVELQAAVLRQRAEALLALASARREQIAREQAAAHAQAAAEVEAEAERREEETAGQEEKAPEGGAPAATQETQGEGASEGPKPSRRRKETKASPGVVKAKRRGGSAKAAENGAGAPDEVSSTSETTDGAGAKADGAPRGTKARKTGS